MELSTILADKVLMVKKESEYLVGQQGTHWGILDYPWNTRKSVFMYNGTSGDPGIS